MTSVNTYELHFESFTGFDFGKKNMADHLVETPNVIINFPPPFEYINKGRELSFMLDYTSDHYRPVMGHYDFFWLLNL